MTRVKTFVERLKKHLSLILRRVATASWFGKTWPTWAIVLGLFGWLVFANSTSRSRPLLCYPCIALAGAGVITHVQRRLLWRWSRLAGIIVTIAVIYLWGCYDTYESEWVNNTTRYTDTYNRWSHQHVYRELTDYETTTDAENSDFLLTYLKRTWEARGPMAGTGKLHGEWHYTYHLRKQPLWEFETKFFWYGEEISEGEWHLRNK